MLIDLKCPFSDISNIAHRKIRQLLRFSLLRRLKKITSLAKVSVILAVSIWKWCTTLNWYLQLRKVVRTREFFESITRGSIVDTARRIGHSLDDESLGIAMLRRGKYTSLLSLDESSEESCNRVKFNRLHSDLRTCKSLTSLITSESCDTNGTNDYDSISNDLSVAEKSMKMLDITAEDVMDARARIQERSYWAGKDAGMSSSAGKMMIYFSFEKGGAETDAARERQTVVSDREGDEEDSQAGNQEETVHVTKDVTWKRRKKTDDSETVLRDKREEMFTVKLEEAVSSISLKSRDITNDEERDHAIPTTSCDFHITSREEKEVAREATEIVQCPSRGYERNMNAKAYSSLVEDTGMILSSVPESYECKWIGESDRRRQPDRVETKPDSISIDTNRKEHSGSLKMSSPTCDCASSMDIYIQKNKKNSRSTDTENKNVQNHDIDTNRSKCLISSVVAQEDELNNEHESALKHLEWCLKKQVQTCQECSEKSPITWDSISLAQIVRPSGYEKRFVEPDKLSVHQTNLKSVQTENSNESENSLSRQSRLKYVQGTRHTQSFDLVRNFESLKEKDCVKFKERKVTRTLETVDFILLDDEKRMRTRNRYNLPPNRKLSAEESEAIELRALKTYNEYTLLKDKKELEAKKRYDLSLKGLEIPKTPDLETHVSFRNEEETKTIRRNDLPTDCKQSVEKLKALAAYSEFTSSDYDLIAGEKHDSSIYEKDIQVPRGALNLLETNIVSDRPSGIEIMRHLSKTRDNPNSDLDLNDHNVRHTRMSLNLREVTRNIEWTLQPGGITLTNKNLQGGLSEGERAGESQQRDIVDNNTVSLLHNALFFKPEIVMRIFRRAQTRLESFSSFGARWREDFNEFVCRVNNEMNVRDRDSLPDFDLDWITAGRDNRSRSLLLNINSSHVAEEENSHDLCIIFLGREGFPSESEITIVENSAELQRSARFNIENVQATNILVFDANCLQTDNAATDNLSVQFIISMLRNFGIEMSEEDIRDVSIEEFGNLSNVTATSDSRFHTNNTNNMSNDVGNLWEKISSSQSACRDDTVDDENKQISCLSNDCSDNLDMSSVKSLEYDDFYDSQDERYLSATDINFQNKISEKNLFFMNVDDNVMSRSLSFDNNNDNNDNRQFDAMNDDKTEENALNVIFENSTKASSSKTSFIKLYDCQTSKSAAKELLKFTQFAEGQAASGSEGERSISNSGIKSDDTISQFQNVVNLRSAATTRNSTRSENEGAKSIYEERNEFSTKQYLGIYSSEESDFNPLYERNGDKSESTLQGSLMEEFSNDSILLTTLPIN